MLQGFLGKVMAGLLSVSSLMFSSYQGNDPAFRPLQSRAGENYLIIVARLEHAFDNDFSDVFKCGKPVNVMFRVDLRHGGSVVVTRTYRHTVTYDPMNAAWELSRSENGRRDIYTRYSQLLEEVSLLECSLPRNSAWRSIEARAEAWLQPVELTQPQRTVDLMMFWKYKRPSTRTSFNLPPTT